MEMIKSALAKVGSPVSQIIDDTEHHILGGIIVALLLSVALWVFI
tara:strand:- start:1126 stop:1260 length:135 start_codon:yes stop_codon:yes gene_type:complete